MNEPNFNKNAPDWFLTIRPGEQKKLDGLYLFALENWKAAAKGWIEDQQRKRDLSPDPANYVPEPFTRAIPQREVSDFGETGMFTRLEPADPNVHLPVLPPYQKPSSGPGFKATPDPKDAAMFNLLIGIDRKLDELLKRG